MASENLSGFDFTLKEFAYNGVQYKVALTPELYTGDGDLDFTGNYQGILISSKKGTIPFELNPNESARWESVPKGMDPGLIDELDKIIQQLRAS